MPTLTIPFDYQIVWTAMELGMTPNEFRSLDWREQAEILAYFKVKGKIDAYYQDSHKRKREEFEQNKGARQ